MNYSVSGTFFIEKINGSMIFSWLVRTHVHMNLLNNFKRTREFIKGVTDSILNI